MKKTRKSDGKSGGVIPASVLLNRLIGPSPAKGPVMLGRDSHKGGGLFASDR